jgi:hypothetical protein
MMREAVNFVHINEQNFFGKYKYFKSIKIS